MNWDQLYWRAYQDGHNYHGLRGHQLDEFARAYADVHEIHGRARAVSVFWRDWSAGRVVPRQSGIYHYDPNAVLHTYHEENGRVVVA